MFRARLAPFAVAGSLLLSTGCSTTSSSSNFDILHPFRSRTMSCPTCPCPCPTGCDCEVGFSAPCCPAPGCASGGCGTVPLISNAHPPLVEGPSLFPPAPTPLMVPPGATMPPVGGPRVTPLPPVVTVPQATATPSPP